MDWGDLVNEDSLPMQGPFLFHVEGSKSAGAVEPGPPLGPVGAGGSAATLGVPVEDRWIGGVGSETIPAVLVEGGSFDATPREVMEGNGSGAAPLETVERSSSGAAPHEAVEGSGSGAAPHEMVEGSPPASEPRVGSKQSRPHELEQGFGGSSPKRTRRPKALEYVTDSPCFSPYFSVPILRFFPIL